jgi:hypothetical protein
MVFRTIQTVWYYSGSIRFLVHRVGKLISKLDARCFEKIRYEETICFNIHLEREREREGERIFNQKNHSAIDITASYFMFL